MNKKTSSLEVFGTSPMGYNGLDSDEVTKIEVPLVYDKRAGTYISKQDVIDLDDRDEDAKRRRTTQREESFRKKIGIR